MHLSCGQGQVETRASAGHLRDRWRFCLSRGEYQRRGSGTCIEVTGLRSPKRIVLAAEWLRQYQMVACNHSDRC